MLESRQVDPNDPEINGLKPGDPGYTSVLAILTGEIVVDDDMRATRRRKKYGELFRRVRKFFKRKP
ncbi:MAG TPA: hypothetical protein VF189_05830 [Patescibacteria group bacterium]